VFPSSIRHVGRIAPVAAAMLLLCLALLPSARAETRPVPRIGFDDDGGTEALLRTLGEPELKAVPIAVRLDIQGAAAGDVEAVRARVARLARAGLQVWLRLADVPAADDADAVRRWRAFVRTVIERTRGQVQLVELPLASGRMPGTPSQRAFLLKVAAVQVRAVDPAVLIGVHGENAANPTWVDEFYAADVAAYVDVLSLPASEAAAAGVVDATGRQIVRLDPDARVVISGEPLPDVPGEARGVLVRTQLERLGSVAACTTYGGSPAAIAAAVPGVLALRDLLAGEVVTLDEHGAELSVRQAAPAPAIRTRLLYSTATFATYLAYWTDRGAEIAADVSLRLPRAGAPMIREPGTGSVRPPAGLERDAATGITHLRVTATGEPRVVDFDHGAANEFALADRTEARRDLTVQEIIARYQQAQAAQDELLDSYSALARMQQHFRPTPADPGYDVVTDSRFFSARDGVEWEELSFSVNGTKWGPDRPAFPLLQDEKVLALPLDIRLTADYVYTLDRVETIGSRACYVVAFEPRSADVSLYSGRVWIDRERFVRLKLQTVQTRLASPIVSSEEIQTFSPVTDAAGHDFFLFSALTARQIVLIAGRNLLIEKDVRFSDFRVNDPAFAGTRQEARSGDRIMFKETDRGLRYFVKENGERRVSDRLTSRAKALAMGVTIDPAYGFPLPIAGLNYIDFEFGNRDSQLALLFGGVLALGNIQRAKLLGGRVDASVDFFAIAVPGSDRVYDAAGEREAERVLTWPLNVGGNLGWQFTDFQKVGVQYVFRFDAYVHDRTTADDYQLPASTVTNGAGVVYEWKRGGYGFTASTLWSHRLESRPWGPAGALEPAQPDYAKYSVGLSKDIFFGAFQKLHLNGAYFGGQRLDRFTQYQFGLFDDTRMHGVPSAGVRFGELVMARGSYAFNVFDQYRLELFLDHAFGRESRDARTWDRLTGTGASFTMRTPFRTMLRADVGKSFLPPANRSTGSVVVQVLVLKPL
jgi:hypothetical protein